MSVCYPLLEYWKRKEMCKDKKKGNLDLNKKEVAL
jgi:hypothetical protein